MKNKKLALAFSVLIVAGLSACVSAGNASIANVNSETVSTQIVKGKTTKDQVRALYGNPNATTSMMDGSEVWVYTFTHAHAKAASFIPIVGAFAGGAIGETKNISIIFDQRGVVNSYSVTASNVNTGFGAAAR